MEIYSQQLQSEAKGCWRHPTDFRGFLAIALLNNTCFAGRKKHKRAKAVACFFLSSVQVFIHLQTSGSWWSSALAVLPQKKRAKVTWFCENEILLGITGTGIPWKRLSRLTPVEMRTTVSRNHGDSNKQNYKTLCPPARINSGFLIKSCCSGHIKSTHLSGLET